MAVPDFQSWFLPLLRRLGDGDLRSMTDIYFELADELGLTEQDRQELLPSGKQKTYTNRIGWARTYLKKAGLIESPKRAHIRITERGQGVLADPPDRLNVAFLKQYEEFQEFHKGSPKDKAIEVIDEFEESPEESLQRIHSHLRDEVKIDLLERIKAAPPHFFERLVVDLLVMMGYGGSREDAGRMVGKSGDGGIDGIINEDKLGLDIVCIQAKRWENTVGRPVVQAFAGSLEGFRAKKGVLITTAEFSKGALEYVKQIEKRIILVDGGHLASLMFEHGLGVSVTDSFEVKRIDTDYFEEV